MKWTERKAREKMYEVNSTSFGGAVINFYVDAYQQTLKRRTTTDADVAALEWLKSMTEELEQALNEKRRVTK